MKKIFSAVFVLLSLSLFAQTPYTQSTYAYDSLMHIVYGVDVNYAGQPDTLEMDIFKPVGDQNCLRPVMILVHGGSWIGGSKEDINMVLMSRELARKGWVVANINWRLGTHKAANYNMYALCNNSISAPCGYISDSAEIFRANYRGMQDAKGAIRFMKGRHLLDSTDIDNVFIAGESAGAFVSYYVAFLDQLSEKPVCCGAIANAPTPSPNLNPYGCIPNQLSLTRPDLGGIDGTLNLNSYDAKVKGIGSFYGAIFDLNIIQQQADTPAVYLFHQGSDVIVDYGFNKVLGRISWECYAQTNLCQSYYFYPYASGSEAIRQYFVSLGSNAPVYQAEILSNYNYLNNCLSNGHSIDNWSLRLQSMVDLFAPIIAASGNNPASNCQSVGINEPTQNSFYIYPNPAQDQFTIQMNSIPEKRITIDILNSFGQEIESCNMNSQTRTINLETYSSGLYIVRIRSGETCLYYRIVKSN
jgi:Secretion system C-terminal sorting domain/Carboxylesterase family